MHESGRMVTQVIHQSVAQLLIRERTNCPQNYFIGCTIRLNFIYSLSTSQLSYFRN